MVLPFPMIISGILKIIVAMVMSVQGYAIVQVPVSVARGVAKSSLFSPSLRVRMGGAIVASFLFLSSRGPTGPS